MIQLETERTEDNRTGQLLKFWNFLTGECNLNDFFF